MSFLKETSQVNRHVLINHTTGETCVKHLTPEQEKDTSHFVEKDTGVELESQEKLSLLEWFANEYKRFGCQLECATAGLPKAGAHPHAAAGLLPTSRKRGPSFAEALEA